MLFKKQHRRKRGAGPLRLILSLFMLAVLVLGIYSAYKSFSGVDPLKISPKNAIGSVLYSDGAYNFVTGLLSFTPKSLSGIIKKNPLIGQNPAHQVYPQSSITSPAPIVKPTPKPLLLFTFAVVSDSHNDNDDLKKALTQAKEDDAKFVIGTGDWTEVGTVDELRNTKQQFDAVGLPYYVIPGDHDLWDSRNRSLPPLTDFEQVFGKDYTSFDYDGDHFLLFDDADNYNGVDQTQMNFIENDLSSANQKNPRLILAFTHEPLYHPSSDHYMGKTEPSLKSQATFLIDYFKSHRVAEVIAGDTHFYTSYTEPTEDLPMTTAGAITAYENLEEPRYLLVDVYDNGSYNIRDTEIKQ